MKKLILLVAVVISAAFFQGCETVKGAQSGAKKDIVNTGHNFGRTVNAVMEADRKFAEKYW